MQELKEIIEALETEEIEKVIAWLKLIAWIRQNLHNL